MTWHRCNDQAKQPLAPPRTWNCGGNRIRLCDRAQPSYHALLVQSMIAMQELPKNTTPSFWIFSRRPKVAFTRRARSCTAPSGFALLQAAPPVHAAGTCRVSQSGLAPPSAWYAARSQMPVASAMQQGMSAVVARLCRPLKLAVRQQIELLCKEAVLQQTRGARHKLLSEQSRGS